MGVSFIFLEFVVWMLYGVYDYEGVIGDLRSLIPAAWNNEKNDISTCPKAHPVVERWVNKMKEDLDPDSALLDLIELIKKKVLVPLNERLGARATMGWSSTNMFAQQLRPLSTSWRTFGTSSKVKSGRHRKLANWSRKGSHLRRRARPTAVQNK